MPFTDRPILRRILEFDGLLRRKESVTASSMARRWEVAPKTVHRFVKFMREEMHAPIEFSSERRTYFYSDESYQPPWLPVDGKDLFAIGIAQKVLQLYQGTPAAEDLAEVYKRLEEFMPREVRVHPSTLLDRLYIHPQPLRIVNREIWDAVTRALINRTVLELAYQKPGKNAEWRDVEPYGLVLAASDWIVVAKDPVDSITKTFFLNRIVSARLTPRPYVIPEEFDIREYLGNSLGVYAGGRPFRFRVRFDREIAPWISEVRWHPNQKLSPSGDGNLELELPAGHIVEARRFILSFGASARAVSPPELVEDIRREIEAMAQTYQGDCQSPNSP